MPYWPIANNQTKKLRKLIRDKFPDIPEKAYFRGLQGYIALGKCRRSIYQRVKKKLP